MTNETDKVATPEHDKSAPKTAQEIANATFFRAVTDGATDVVVAVAVGSQCHVSHSFGLSILSLAELAADITRDALRPRRV